MIMESYCKPVEVDVLEVHVLVLVVEHVCSLLARNGEVQPPVQSGRWRVEYLVAVCADGGCYPFDGFGECFADVGF